MSKRFSSITSIMSADRSSSSTEVQPAMDDESTQTKDSQILNQDVKTGDSEIASGDHDKSSSPEIQAAHEIHQTTASDANKHDNPLAPDIEAKTDESTKVATTQLQDPVSDSAATRTASGNQEDSSPPEVQPTTTPETSISQISEADENKQSNASSAHDPVNPSPPEVRPTDSPETLTTQIADSDANKHATHGSSSLAEVQPTTQTVDSDANKHATEISSTLDPGNSSPPEVQPSTAPATSTTQIPDSDANKQATAISTNDLGSSSPPQVQPTDAPETSTTQMPDSDASKHATIIPAHDPGTSPIVAPETSTPQIPDSDANKHDPGNSSPPEVSTPTHDSTEGSTTKVVASNQESTTNPPVASSDNNTASATNHPKISSPEIQQATDPPTEIAPTDLPGPTPEQKPNKEITPSDSTPEQERKHLMNLIDQELKFVEKVCPKLGRHQEHIKKEATEATNMFGKLKNEPCELKELKDLKKIVTKLKLQIPAKYRTYDEIDQQENKQFDMDNGGVIPPKLLKKMPQLHDQLFNDSPFCKTIQKRYNDLRRELKLCLLCFSVFPENAIISRRLMVYWWMGEGLILLDDDSGFEKTTEDRANRYFEELMEEDFIEPVSKRHGRNVATCKMHPMVRAALVMIADRVKFFDFDEYGNPKDFGKFDEIESPEDVPLIYPLGEPREFFDFYNEQDEETYETIQFHDSSGNPIPFAPRHPDNILHPVDRNGKPIVSEKKFYFYEKKKITTNSYKVCLMGSGLSKGIPWEKLHMLFNVKDDILEFKPEWFLRMKNVNVVFLGRWQSSAAHHIEVEEFKFKESLEHMNHVRFFSLQGVSRISELPRSISKLESLLILDLRACHNLEVIPKTIGLLKCLTHLDMAECYLLEHMPKEISSLESLEVLKGFVVVESPGRHICTLNDLRKLGNLRKLSMYTHMKEFPQESHLDALQKFERLRKLTILWGGHESKPKSDKLKQDLGCQSNLASKMMKLIPRKQWVKGSMRRMNAFNNSTLGSRLEKLDLKCFPDHVTPNWLTPGSLKGLKKLYIRGGQFSDLGQYQDIYEWETSPIPAKDTWNVEVLRLKYLDELKMDWRELQNLFPKMNSLEKVKCPRLTLFPCNEHGVWTKKPTTT
ncbi:hypothetical protein L6452_31134 [Arctium lappa]|uniref:Uncharacterized protein n=1 Tax=Arctium lappa TaxID=4217 RepID=A0ACB8ZL30_ARCLA|nr:hypothetical protein L6452_31134 [Arctium lappa]